MIQQLFLMISRLYKAQHSLTLALYQDLLGDWQVTALGSGPLEDNNLYEQLTFSCYDAALRHFNRLHYQHRIKGYKRTGANEQQLGFNFDARGQIAS